MGSTRINLLGVAPCVAAAAAELAKVSSTIEQLAVPEFMFGHARYAWALPRTEVARVTYCLVTCPPNASRLTTRTA